MLCDKLMNRFVGLPAQTSDAALPPGQVPLDGRWWVRSCFAESTGSALRLRIAGPGWFWVDEKQSGFRVQQYVYFRADVQMTGSLDVGYDRSSQIASIWFTPASGGWARVQPLGEVNASPEGFWPTLFTIASLGALGVYADSEARQEVAAEGSKRFEQRLAQGVTATLDLTRWQYDLQLGQLPQGRAPQRPFEDASPWLANERQRLFPSGVHVAGPFEPGPAAVDLRVESGRGANYLGVCQRDLQLTFEQSAAGRPQVRREAVFAQGSVASGSSPSLPVQATCPWYLVTSPAAGGSSILAVRVRPTASTAAAPAAHAHFVRVTLLSFKIGPRNSAGDRWDIGGGAPDPRFSLYSSGKPVLLGRYSDTFEESPTVAAPNAYELTAQAPLRITAHDVDAAIDDIIGTVEITVDDLRSAPLITKAIVHDGHTTGSVTLRLEVVGRQ